VTHEEQKGTRGPSPDDPLEDDAAVTWVRQYNEQLASPSKNALEGVLNIQAQQEYCSAQVAALLHCSCITCETQAHLHHPQKAQHMHA
jgi:hypothetical protein